LENGNNIFQLKKTCLQTIVNQKWPEGFCCLHCHPAKGRLLQTRHVFECANCHPHTSTTANSLFHNTKLPLVKGCCCISAFSSTKGNIFAMQLSTLIDRSWIIADTKEQNNLGWMYANGQDTV